VKNTSNNVFSTLKLPEGRTKPQIGSCDTGEREFSVEF